MLDDQLIEPVAPVLSEQAVVNRRRLRDEFAFYAEYALRIRTKGGELRRLQLNRAQQHVNDLLDAQLRKTGMVRAIILKGRQMGMSTLIGARFYHRVTHRIGVRAYILTHLADATENLFAMTDRFHQHCPVDVKPHTGLSNAKELYFDVLDSGYQVGTAGSKGTGRSSTIQYFHGSEVAFWPNAQDHLSGVMQAVPLLPDTEVVLESTANGVGNTFHSLWQEAEAGLSAYQAIFVPWFWDDQYRLPVSDKWRPTAEEADYQTLYKLDNDQMAWRRHKIGELKSDELFNREYPATPGLAFTTTNDKSFIPGTLTSAARACRIEHVYGAKLIGVDPARYGDDRTAVAWRQGRRCYRVETKHHMNTMEVAGWCARILRDDKPDKMFVDAVGLGAGVYDRLIELGHGDRVIAVNGGSKPSDKQAQERYLNKRAECWGEMRAWFSNQPCQIPDDDAMEADLIGPSYRVDSAQRLQIEGKDEMKKRGIRSPDSADALSLTFAEHVAAERQVLPEPGVYVDS